MSLLVTVVVSIGILSVLNLLLTLALARGLRHHAELLARQSARPGPPQRMKAGTQVPAFRFADVNGAEVSLEKLRGGRSLVGFFAPNCPPCQRQVEAFATAALAFPGGLGQVLAVICGDQEESGVLTGELAGAATVIHEPHGGPAAAVFSVTGFPTFYLLDPVGLVEASGLTVRAVAPADKVTAAPPGGPW